MESHFPTFKQTTGSMGIMDTETQALHLLSMTVFYMATTLVAVTLVQLCLLSIMATALSKSWLIVALLVIATSSIIIGRRMLVLLRLMALLQDASKGLKKSGQDKPMQSGPKE